MEIGFLIAISFCIIILLIILKWSNIHWLIKAFLTISAIPIVFAFHFGFANIMGWPAEMIPTCLMRVEGVDIREPMGDYKGDIFIWYVDEDEYQKTHKHIWPRAIRVPYTKENHKKFSEANEGVKHGMPMFMKFNNNNVKPKGDLKLGEGGSQTAQGEADFVKPPNTLPPKHRDDGQEEE